jgi:tetratricopeptide (TPR) repeat protein
VSIAALSFLTLLASAPNNMGTIAFPITGNKQCQKHFTAGMLAYHSFMYDDAHDQFKAGQKADPSCAMAFWGDAMAYSHPLWGEEEIANARTALGAITNEAKLTPKERAWIATARVFWGDGDYKSRLAAWLRATEKMRAEFPKDDEIAMHHALALIANSERLTKTKLLMQSTAISMDVFRRQPNHPGAAHYLIHACDTPDHAILALDAAKQYAKIAPAASHAQHMPSHIFVQLGMHAEVAASNEVSWAASEQEIAKRKLPDDERDWHSYSWLNGAYLELGKVKSSEKLLDDLRALILRVDGASMRFGYSLMTNAYVRQTAQWDRVDELVAAVLRPLPLEPGESDSSMGCALHAPGQTGTSMGCALHAPGQTGKTRPPLGLMSMLWAHNLRAEAAMRRGDEKALNAALEGEKKIYEAMAPWKGMRAPDFDERRSRLNAMLLAGTRARKQRTPQAWDEAIAAAKKLAEMRETLVGGPAVETPYPQHLGDLLLEAGRPKEALAAYDAALNRYPNHVPALLAAARAAKAAGDQATARERYAVIATQWKAADANNPLLAEVQTGAQNEETRGTK